MQDYTVNIYVVGDTKQALRFHLSNSSLYVTPDPTNLKTVTFTDPTCATGTCNAAGWYVYFKDASPFCTMTTATTCTPVGQDSNHKIVQATGKMYLVNNSPLKLQDYNYLIEIDGPHGNVLVKEDPQVIIGGKGGKGLWDFGLVGAGLAVLLIAIMSYRAFFGKAKVAR
jgi:hypothetical protein